MDETKKLRGAVLTGFLLGGVLVGSLVAALAEMDARRIRKSLCPVVAERVDTLTALRVDEECVEVLLR